MACVFIGNFFITGTNDLYVAVKISKPLGVPPSQSLCSSQHSLAYEDVRHKRLLGNPTSALQLFDTWNYEKWLQRDTPFCSLINIISQVWRSMESNFLSRRSSKLPKMLTPFLPKSVQNYKKTIKIMTEQKITLLEICNSSNPALSFFYHQRCKLFNSCWYLTNENGLTTSDAFSPNYSNLLQ